MSGADDRLSQWRGQIFFRLMYLADVDLPDVDLDFTGPSLRAVERELVAAVGRPDVEAVATYLGETLMRLAGGAWEWDDGPVVRADPALGLAPVAPVRLVLAAAEAGDGERFATRYAEWAAAVARLTRQRPGWRPVKEPTNADGPPTGSPHLDAWLAARAAAFPAWTAAYGPGVRWDFSPATLDALETVLRRVAGSEEELHAPANREFRDGAAWYLGEVLRRGLGGQWRYDERVAAEANLEYVDGLGPTGSESIPVVWLEIALTEPGALRAHFVDFSA